MRRVLICLTEKEVLHAFQNSVQNNVDMQFLCALIVFISL